MCARKQSGRLVSTAIGALSEAINRAAARPVGDFKPAQKKKEIAANG
jgi:hypothetical protein